MCCVANKSLKMGKFHKSWALQKKVETAEKHPWICDFFEKFLEVTPTDAN